MIKFNRFKDGKRFALTFSYDDGCAQDRRLVELFNKYKMKATFNLNSGSVMDPNTAGVRADEVRALYIENGHEVACHAVNHPRLEQLSVKEQYEEIIRDREALEQLTGTIVRGFAYPYGTYNSDTLAAMDVASIAYGRAVKETGSLVMPEDFKVWRPTTHHNDCASRVRYFIKCVEKEPWNAGELLYIWGHAYEFDEESAAVKWEEFENFLSALSKCEHDVWSATNIEIYDYIKASKAIRISADGKRLYNPTDTDVWASNDGKTICIKAASELEL